MSFKQIHIKKSSDIQAFHPENLSQNLIIELDSHITNTQINRLYTSAPNLFVWITVSSMIIWILFEIIRELDMVKISDKLAFAFIHSKCRNCQFYATNPYLKCAVHPSVVLTKQARNCIDYCDKK